MASRRSRLQIKPNLGPKAKPGPPKPAPGSTSKSESTSDGIVVKGKPRPTLSLSGVQSGAKDGPLSPRKSVLLSPTKQAISSPIKSHLPSKNPLRDKNVSASKNITGTEQVERSVEVKYNKETSNSNKETDFIDGRSNENREHMESSSKDGDGKETGVETAKSGPSLISRKRKFQPNLNIIRKPTGEGDEGSKIKALASPVKSVKFNMVAADRKMPDNQDNISENKDSESKKMEDQKDSEESSETKKQRQKKYTIVKSSFSADAPIDRTKMKMSDLVFWNPNRNHMKKKLPLKPKTTPNDSSETKEQNDVKSADAKSKDDVPTPNPLLMGSREESKVDDPDTEEEEEGDTPMPVPQVKIGPDGNLIINEESLVIKNKEKTTEETNTEVIDETDSFTTYQSFRAVRFRSFWSEKQTAKFYKALQCIGTDFTLMEKIFPKRSRHELKNKFVKEDRENRQRIEKALEDKLPFDLSLFDNDDDEDERKTNRKPGEKRGHKPKKKNGDTTSKLLNAYLETSSRSSTMDSKEVTQSEKRPKRKTKRKQPNYYVLSEEESEEEGNQFTVMQNKKHKAEQNRSAPVVLEQSNVAPPKEDNGPLILVYNKATDGGETVIHVYRLQPDMLPSVSSADVGTPVTMSINADHATSAAPPSGTTQVMDFLGSNVASQNVQVLPPNADSASCVVMVGGNKNIIIPKVDTGSTMKTNFTQTRNVVPSEQHPLPEKSNSASQVVDQLSNTISDVRHEGLLESISGTQDTTTSSDRFFGQVLPPRTVPQTLKSRESNSMNFNSSNAQHLIPDNNFIVKRNHERAEKQRSLLSNVPSTSSTVVDSRLQEIYSHDNAISLETCVFTTTVSVKSVSGTHDTVAASNSNVDQVLPPGTASQTLISRERNSICGSTSNTQRLIPYNKYMVQKNSEGSGKQHSLQSNVPSASVSVDNSQPQESCSHNNVRSLEASACTSTVSKSRKVIDDTNTDEGKTVYTSPSHTNPQMTSSPPVLSNPLDSPLQESQIVYLPTNSNSGQFGFFVPLPLQSTSAVTPVLNQVTGVTALPEGITWSHEENIGDESNEVGVENIMVVNHDTGPLESKSDCVAIDINFRREFVNETDKGNKSGR